MSGDNLTVIVHCSVSEFFDMLDWLNQKQIGTYINIERSLNRVTFSFANDTDALLFKLTWSDYL